MLTHTILCGNSGYYVESFDEDAFDGDGGIAYWYGSREACQAYVDSKPSPTLVPSSSSESGPPYDAATATGMYDH